MAVAVQTLLARELADDSRPPKLRIAALKHLINGSIVSGGIVALTLSFVTFFKRSYVIAGLTTNTAVQATALSFFPAVLATQGALIIISDNFHNDAWTLTWY